MSSLALVLATNELLGEDPVVRWTGLGLVATMFVVLMKRLSRPDEAIWRVVRQLEKDKSERDTRIDTLERRNRQLEDLLYEERHRQP